MCCQTDQCHRSCVVLDSGPVEFQNPLALNNQHLSPLAHGAFNVSNCSICIFDAMCMNVFSSDINLTELVARNPLTPLRGGMQDIKTCERFTAAPITKQLQEATAAAVQVRAARPGGCCVKTNKARFPACLCAHCRGTVTPVVDLRYHQQQTECFVAWHWPPTGG